MQYLPATLTVSLDLVALFGPHGSMPKAPKGYDSQIMAFMIAKGIDPAKSEHVRCMSSEQMSVGIWVLSLIAV